MADPSLPKAYLTLTEANAITALSDDSDWTAASNSVKSDALSYGRAYIDSRYYCSFDNYDDDDNEDIPAVVKMGNALFALQHVKGALFKEPERQVTRERVVADTVEVEESYATSGNARRLDPHPTISAIIAAYCSWQGGGAQTASVIRA